MAKLAIKGHLTRGKEVIEILEMLGGKNIHNYNGTFNECYVIDNDKICTIYTSVAQIDGFVIFTLEEFLEKFPYKVGDKVLYHDNKVYIKSMKWGIKEIIYTIEWEKELWETTVFYLQPYKEETIEENLTIQDIKDNNAEWLLNKLQETSFKKVLQIISNLYDELHKPQYPKTFVECCEILYPNENFQLIALPFKGHNYKKLFAFQKLLVCRDAYWKIAGEQMKLGKPWKPDWESESITKYVISQAKNKIRFLKSYEYNHILSFPTTEMREAFYENFKELIEQCKELL